MKTAILFVLVLSFFVAHSQDIIVKEDGTSIQAKVDEIGIDVIKYHKFDNLKGPVYSINKKDVVIVNFENGTFELIKPNVEENGLLLLSLEETKDVIVEYINNYSFVYLDENKKYIASFEDDLLRLIIVNENEKKANYNLLFDFFNVYKFVEIDKRTNAKAYLNIYVSRVYNKEKDKRSKDKLVLGIRGFNEAKSLLKALKHFNVLLKGN
ncbi:MAG: hypothetical protein L3J09_00470 [Flavobacteriaceae bacterium]|nr:hypothetical protein [Flavobacteriaceae bacterium]